MRIRFPSELIMEKYHMKNENIKYTLYICKLLIVIRNSLRVKFDMKLFIKKTRFLYSKKKLTNLQMLRYLQL